MITSAEGTSARSLTPINYLQGNEHPCGKYSEAPSQSMDVRYLEYNYVVVSRGFFLIILATEQGKIFCVANLYLLLQYV